MTNDSIGSKPLLGEILVKKKKITAQQLEEALQFQRKKKQLIGEILVNLGYVEEQDIVVALIMQCGLPYFAINKYTINKEILTSVPEEVAKEYHVIPLDRVGDVLTVVMADPLNQDIKTELEKLTKCKIIPVIATETEIHQA